MGRLAGIAGACGAAICGTGMAAQPATAAPARAERPLGRAMAQAARVLATIIRHDARRISSASATGAVLGERRRGARVLRVFYRSRPRGYLPWYGAYELKLRTHRTHVDRVTVSYFPTEASWSYGGPPAREGPTYAFTISRDGRSGWRFSALDSMFACQSPSTVAGSCEGLSQGLGFGERQGSMREFKALYRQALVVAHKGKRHRAISGENLFAASEPRGAR